MAFSMSKKKPKAPMKVEMKPKEYCCSFVKVPFVLSLLLVLYLWSSSSTIISGKIVHVCVSTRKLNSLYCLSAGTQPSFEIPVSTLEKSTGINENEVKEENPNPAIEEVKKETLGLPIVDNGTFHSPVVYEDVKKEIPSSDSPIKVNEEVKREISFPIHDPTVGDEIIGPVTIVKDYMRVLRSWTSKKKRDTCDGRGIYVYDLPSKFNKDLVGHCEDMAPFMDCKHFTNGGLGEPIPELGPAWFNTHQYALEPIFHSRALNHPCRVHSEDEAKLFYVPFYGGLDILRWHFRNVSSDVKDSLGLDLIKWLQRQNSWTKNAGRDHVFVLGKISWDFRRRENFTWGTRFLELEQMQNPAKILIERQPWHEGDIGVPHPTFFHPRSDDEIATWQNKIISSERRSLVGFAGAARPDDPDSIRSTLIDQCKSVDSERCMFLNCKFGACKRPESVTQLFLESEFCLQPPGDSPTRKSVFDSLVAGCIPVLFDPYTAYYQYPWHLPDDHGKYSVFVDQKEVRDKKVNVIERLTKVTKRERDDMRRFIVYEVLPGLLYGGDDARFDRFQDAFSITIDSLLERVNALGSSQTD